jgi:hypothetical protein
MRPFSFRSGSDSIRGEGAMQAVQISVRAESEGRPSGCGRGQG